MVDLPLTLHFLTDSEDCMNPIPIETRMIATRCHVNEKLYMKTPIRTNTDRPGICTVMVRETL